MLSPHFSNPRFQCDDDGQWWYHHTGKNGRPERSRASLVDCAACGYQFPQRRTAGAKTCSAYCGRSRPVGSTCLNAKTGQLLVKVPPGTPFSSKGWMLEHRWVMSQYMGRSLRPDESVHHINGNPADNRIENLQLRQGKHGSGVVYRCRSCGSHDVEEYELG